MNNKFVFIVPAYNAAETIGRSIFSVWFQTYQNWKMIVIDDMSTDNTVDVVNNMKSMLGLSDEKLTLIKNEEKKWEVRNILESLKFCDSEDIVCRLDGDDWLCDTDALSIINRRYWETGCNVLWTSHRWDFTNINISRSLPFDEDPYTFPWVSSHFKTFRKKLIEGVKDENFRGEDGEYFKRIGDQAIYLPVLHQSKGNWHFEPIVAYHYTIKMEPETFQSDDAKFQKNEAEFLRKRGFIK
jgi:glycosyltransferase involved in cell wall biosynthesis